MGRQVGQLWLKLYALYYCVNIHACHLLVQNCIERIWDLTKYHHEYKGRFMITWHRCLWGREKPAKRTSLLEGSLVSWIKVLRKIVHDCVRLCPLKRTWGCQRGKNSWIEPMGSFPDTVSSLKQERPFAASARPEGAGRTSDQTCDWCKPRPGMCSAGEGMTSLLPSNTGTHRSARPGRLIGAEQINSPRTSPNPRYEHKSS